LAGVTALCWRGAGQAARNGHGTHALTTVTLLRHLWLVLKADDETTSLTAAFHNAMDAGVVGCLASGVECPVEHDACAGV
jgi:hypothetical protein